MATVYFAGSEDIDFTFAGAAIITTNSGFFRPTFCRSAVIIGGGTTGDYCQNANPFAASAFWAGARCSWGFVAGNVNNFAMFDLCDVNGIVRIRARFNTGGGPPNNMTIEKVTAAGVATTLFTVSFISDTVATGVEATQLAWHVNYTGAGGGFVELYYKGVLLGSFSGDPTTDGITSLAFLRLLGNGGGNNVKWSEVMVTDFDIRACSLQTFAPVANGNTHNFDTGTPAAANVNEVTLNVATLDGSTTAGQIDEYTTAAVATGTFDVAAYGVSALMSKGTSGPSKADLAVRTGGADFFSADFALGVFYLDYQNWWMTNPNTGVAWLTSQIGSTAGFNIGVKSVT